MAEFLVKTALVGDLRRLPEGSLRSVFVPTAACRLAKPQQERAPIAAVEPAGLECQPVEAQGLLVGVDRSCALRCSTGVVDGNARFSGGSGEDKVVRELRERRVCPGARKRLERPGDPKMQLAPD